MKNRPAEDRLAGRFSLRSEWESECRMENVMALETELETYKNHLGEWSEFVGQYVLIKEEDIVGFYSTYSDAVKFGYERFGLESFLVKQIRVIQHVQFVPPFTRVSDGALHIAD